MTIRAPQADVSQSSTRSGQVSGKPGAVPEKAAGASAAAVSDDTVTLTGAAAQLLRLEESLASMPEVDSSRVAQFKAAIAEGSYQVDPEKIVQRLLSVENDLF